MAFVVTENCIKCKYTDCVEVCPVDCFHEGPNFLVIDPEECIDCTGMTCMNVVWLKTTRGNREHELGAHAGGNDYGP